MQPKDITKIQDLLKLFDIDSSQIKIEETDELITVTVELDETEAGRLIGRFASTLDSLQLLISLMVNHGETHKHVLLDVAGYRARRLSTLEIMLANAKAQIRQTNAPCALPPLSATERRQIHLMLKDDDEFTSSSQGYGQDRRLFVSPKEL